MNCEICVIGSEAFLFPFLQFGFTTFAPASERELRDYLSEVIAANYGIIFIEDSFCDKIKDVLTRYQYSRLPILIPLGESDEGNSFSRRMIREMMERAIGINVL